MSVWPMPCRPGGAHRVCGALLAGQLRSRHGECKLMIRYLGAKHHIHVAFGLLSLNGGLVPCTTIAGAEDRLSSALCQATAPPNQYTKNCCCFLAKAEECAMRAALTLILPLVLVALYVVDQYQYDGHYMQSIWQQGNAEVLILQKELRAWWRAR